MTQKQATNSRQVGGIKRCLDWAGSIGEREEGDVGLSILNVRLH